MDNVEPGLVALWNAQLPSDKNRWNDVNHLSCDKTVWTANVGNDERKPVTCVSWYEAYAFCIWDGGFLASYNELNYAIMGGDLERPRPWGSEPVSPDRATYCSIMDC